MSTTLSQMNRPRPKLEAVKSDYTELESALRGSESEAELEAVIARWQTLRIELSTWRTLATIRFRCDTNDAAAKAEREESDKLSGPFTELDGTMKKACLEHPRRDFIEALFGRHILAIWKADLEAYSPLIEAEFVRERDLAAEYVEVLANLEVEYKGTRYPLTQMSKFNNDADRDVRRASTRAVWAVYAEQTEQLDKIYDDLVATRTTLAQKLGYKNFTDVGYKRMSRVEFGPSEVARFRDEIRHELVPLCLDIRAEQAKRLGIDAVHFWDESTLDAGGTLVPDMEHFEDATVDVLNAVAPAAGALFERMAQSECLDLHARTGKAGGGFCTILQPWKMPFVFANFTGTHSDIRTLVHEMGHGFQLASCAQKPIQDHHYPTMEVCEIHSMGLEFLTWPAMERFFGDEAERFRRTHLSESLCFLPYGAAIDHFQHEVYDHPELSPVDRRAIWTQLEGEYLPWRRYGDLEGAEGGLWQRQRHLYVYPFYYIDYVLALSCALQYWSWSRRDREAAVRSYVELCQLGGEFGFSAALERVGLRSPFEAGCLTDVVEEARAYLFPPKS